MWKSAIARAKRLRDHGRKSEPIVKKEDYLWRGAGECNLSSDSDRDSDDHRVEAGAQVGARTVSSDKIVHSVN